jgi:hypothetical protein
MWWQALGVMSGVWGGGGVMRGWAAHTKDLLDSRSVVYYSLTLTIDDSLPVYARCCVRPIAGLSTGRGGGGDGLKNRQHPGSDAAGAFRLELLRYMDEDQPPRCLRVRVPLFADLTSSVPSALYHSPR